MRLRIRGPNGQSSLTLPDEATIRDLQRQIAEATSITEFDIKYGYPPQPFAVDEAMLDTKLVDLSIRLSGEQLTVSERSAPQREANIPSIASGPLAEHRGGKDATKPTSAEKSLSLSRKPKSQAAADAPELPLPGHASTMVLRIMPDDNSCLFRAFNSAFFGSMDNMTELRSIIAQTIHENPDEYPDWMLDNKKPDDYCIWIQQEDSWGGAIELGILSKHFDIEICSVDVQSLRVDHFNQGRKSRCILVYSGIHYDVVALSPSDPPYDKAYAPPEFDVKVFDSDEAIVLDRATELCRVLQKQHYYTDTAGFDVKCNVCGGVFKGEKGASGHASETGHYDFAEAT